jgi:pimeloyl-ACP methyl ester carboxylesterase
MHYSSHEATAGAAKLRVRTAGEGPTLILLPGMARPATDLDPFAALLVVAGYRVVQPDPRGIGGSTGPLDGITLHDLAADIAAVIEAVGGAPVVVIGHAFGNRVARCVAADRPDLVRAVVLLSSSGKVQPAPEIADAIRIAQDASQSREARAAAARKAWFGPGRDITIWLDGWIEPVRKAQTEAAAATDVADWWTAGRAQVLIVQGLADVSALPANGRLLKDEIGDRATLVELEDIGHAVPIEDPRAVASVVHDWLQRNP